MARAISSDIAAASIQAIEGIFQFAARSLALNFARGSPDERRLAGENLAEYRAEGKDVTALVEPVDFAAGLFGSHVRGVPITLAGFGQVGV